VTVGRQAVQGFNQEASGKEWLTKESDISGFPGPHFDLLIVATGYEYHGEFAVASCKLTHEFDAATVTQVHIDDEANRSSSHYRVEEFARGIIEFCIKSLRRQQTAHGFKDAEVIVDNRNHGAFR
jgi:hypothetical protein